MKRMGSKRNVWANIATTVLAVVLLAGCKDDSNSQFVVNGVLQNGAGKKLLLAELPYASPNRIVVDSATADSSGHFHLQTVHSQESIYQLFVADGPGFLLINDVPEIEVSADLQSPENYSTKGSPATENIRKLYKGFVPALQQYQTALAANTLPAGKQVSDSLRSATLLKRDETDRQLQLLLHNFLGGEKNATARYFALGMAKQFLPQSEWNAQLEKALVAFPKHPGLSLLKVKMSKASPGSHLLNKPVPELLLPDTSGTIVAISSFRGKWVLIDCWASWCAPCRKENPNVVASWRKYNKRNFTVLGVSLDKDRNAWLGAIAKDSLSWTQVSDLKEWNSKATETFDLQAIPFNLLVDPQGMVKAVNLTDTTLHQTLANMLILK